MHINSNPSKNTDKAIQDGYLLATALGKRLAGHPPGVDLSRRTQLPAAGPSRGAGPYQQSVNRTLCHARGSTGHTHTWWRQGVSHHWQSLLGLLWCHGPMGPAVQLQRGHLPVLLRLLLLPLLLPVQGPQLGPEFLLQLRHARVGQHGATCRPRNGGPPGTGPRSDPYDRVYYLWSRGHHGAGGDFHQTRAGEKSRRADGHDQLQVGPKDWVLSQLPSFLWPGYCIFWAPDDWIDEFQGRSICLCVLLSHLRGQVATEYIGILLQPNGAVLCLTLVFSSCFSLTADWLLWHNCDCGNARPLVNNETR